MQKQLLDLVLAASERSGIKVVLRSYRDSPRLGLSVATSEMALELLDACQHKVKVSDPRTGKILSREKALAKSQGHLRIWRPLLVGGRMIHGCPSGIDLTIIPEVKLAEHVTFPHPAFSDLWLNQHLIDRQIWVDEKLLERRAKSKRPKKVDIVFTWVNDQDSQWQNKRSRYRPDEPTSDATDIARFANNDEIIYALRGLFRYFDGIGRVFLVTDDQRPTFWDEFSDRVICIDHSQIMGPDVARPTFNSHVIESCLHHIPNLSEQYLYINDDVIITNTTGVSDFFDDQGRAKVFYSEKNIIPKGSQTNNILAADAAAMNTRELFAKQFDHVITRKFQHCPIALNRNTMITLENQFNDIFLQLRQKRFRSQTDVAPSGSLYQHYAIMTNQAIPSKISYRYLNIAERKFPTELLRLSIVAAHKRPIVVCLNAVIGGADSKLNRFSMTWQMRRLIPENANSTKNTSIKGHLHRMILEVILFLYYHLKS